MQIQVTNIHHCSNGTVERETTNQILHRLGRSVLPRLIGAIAILVSYVLFLPRSPLPQGAGSTFAPRSLCCRIH